MFRCEKCFEIIDAESKFCSFCGEPITAAAPPLPDMRGSSDGGERKPAPRLAGIHPGPQIESVFEPAPPRPETAREEPKEAPGYEADVSPAVKILGLAAGMVPPFGLITGFCLYSVGKNSKWKSFGHTILLLSVMTLIIGIAAGSTLYITRHALLDFLDSLRGR